MSAGAQNTTALVRISREAYDEMVKMQQEFYDEHHGVISIKTIVDQLLAGRKPVQS